MSKHRKNGKRREPLPDLRDMGVIVAQEDDGSLFDLGRYGELEALGVSAMGRAQKARDELIRRAAIVLGRMDRDITIADLQRMGVRGIRQHGIEFVLEPVKDVFVIYEYDPHTSRRGEALFWIFLCLSLMTPGGGSPVFRGPDDNPIASVQIRVGGRPEIIGAIKSVDWYAPGNRIDHNGDNHDDLRAGERDRGDAGDQLRGGGAGSDAAPREEPTGEGAA